MSKVELKRLRGELKAAGVFEHREKSGWIKLVSMAAVLALSGVGLAYGGLWSWLVLVPLGAVATTTATLIGHESSHGSFSSRSASNQLLVHLTLPLLAGISGLYWKHKHNSLHHGHPNVLGSDPDIELWPMATSRLDYERAAPWQRWFQRYLQGYLFWPAATTLPTVMRAPSYRFLFEQLRARGLERACVLDASCLAIHYLLWLGLPALLWGALPALALYVSLWALVGILLALVFAPAHLGLPLVVRQEHSIRHQLETTRNLRTPRWLSWFCVGLDYQIEHHIFPQIPHQNLHTAAIIMRRWCSEVGLPYQEVGYGEALSSVTTYVRDAWQLDPATMRPRPAVAAAAAAPVTT